MKINRTLQNPIYFGAKPKILEHAKELRKNMTETEKILWKKLRKKQIDGYRFRRQHPLMQFIADFYCHEAKLVIEVDGGYHQSPEQKELDESRTYELEQAGIKVVRLSNDEVMNNIDSVIETIKIELLRNTGAHPPCPPNGGNCPHTADKFQDHDNTNINSTQLSQKKENRQYTTTEFLNKIKYPNTNSTRLSPLWGEMSTGQSGVLYPQQIAKQKNNYKIMRKVLSTLLIGTFVLFTNTFAQVHQPEFSGYEEPGATDMVNLVTGDFTYSMPLLHVPGPEGGFTLPLSYHAGIKLKQEATWVGLGWSLFPGGISRNIAGVPDDFSGQYIENTIYNSGDRGYNFNISIGPLSGSVIYSSNKGYGGSIGLLGINAELGNNGINDIKINTEQIAIGLIKFGVSLIAQNIPEANQAIQSIKTVTNSKTFQAVQSTSTILGMASSLSNNYNRGLWDISTRINPIPTIVSTILSYYLDIPLYATLSYNSYKLNVNEGENAYGILYAHNAPFIEPTEKVVYYGQSTSLESLNLYRKYSGEEQDNVLGDFIQGVGNKKNLAKNGAVFNGYDSYQVMSEGISGAIEPYRLEIGSVAGSQTGENYDYHIWTFNPSPYLNYHVPFKYKNEPGNQYLYQLNNENDDLSEINIDVENSMGILYDEGHPRYTDEKLFNPDKRIESERTGLSGYKLSTGKNIEWFTNEDIKNESAFNYSGFMDKDSPEDRETQREVYISDDDIPKSTDNSLGIGGFCITNSDGNMYHYALPIYSKYYYTRTTTQDGDESATISDLSLQNKYAIDWLITGKTGSDFVDRGGGDDFNEPNGTIDEHDWGSWVKFDYTQCSDRSEIDNSYSRDGKSKIYSCNTIESYYLRSIETRSHVALFIKSEYGPDRLSYEPIPSSNERAEAYRGTYKYYKLDKIILLTRSDYKVLINLYSSILENYLLGKNTSTDLESFLQERQLNCTQLNYDFYLRTATNTSRKRSPTENQWSELTLTSIETLYQNNQKILPGYNFEYSEHNPEYNSNNWDAWGYYKSNGVEYSYNRPSTGDGDEWCLNKITTPLGATIDVEYEKDQYSYVSGYPITRTELLPVVEEDLYNQDYLDQIDYEEIHGKLPRDAYTTTVNITKTGGGLRVNNIIISDENDVEYSTRYNYGKGHVSLEPMFDRYDLPQIYGQNKVGNIKNYPNTPVMYENVTVYQNTSTDDISDYTSYEEYNFKMFDHSDVYIQGNPNIYSFSEGNDSRFCDFYNYIIHSKIGNTGALLNKTTKNKNENLIEKVKYNYSFLTDKNIGYYSDVTLSQIATRERTSRVIDKNNYIRTTTIQYPSFLSSIETTVNGVTSIVTNKEYDFITGNVISKEINNGKGKTYLEKTIPAYWVYPEMGSKVTDPSYSNMLSQTAANVTYLLDAKSKDWKVINAGIQTWNNNWPYRLYMDELDNDKYVNINLVNDEPWRKHKSYIYSGNITRDGWYSSFGRWETIDAIQEHWSDFVDETNLEDSYGKWQKTSEITRYDVYSHPQEVKDLLGNYSSSKYRNADSRTLISASNAAYTEMAYSGMEDEIDENGYLSGEVKPGNGTFNTTYAHTGQNSLEVAANSKGFSYKVAIGSEWKTNRLFKMSAWVRGGTTDNMLRCINGSPGTQESFTAGDWTLLTRYIEIPQQGVLEFYCYNNSGSTVYFDDFRVQPIDAAATCYVYDKYGNTTATLDNDNIATKMDYDAAGNLLAVYKETPSGFQKVKEYEYGYATLNSINSFEVSGDFALDDLLSSRTYTIGQISGGLSPYSYNWEINGGASISGSATGSSVTVNNISDNFTLIITVTDAANLSNKRAITVFIDRPRNFETSCSDSCTFLTGESYEALVYDPEEDVNYTLSINGTDVEGPLTIADTADWGILAFTPSNSTGDWSITASKNGFELEKPFKIGQFIDSNPPCEAGMSTDVSDAYICLWDTAKYFVDYFTDTIINYNWFYYHFEPTTTTVYDITGANDYYYGFLPPDTGYYAVGVEVVMGCGSDTVYGLPFRVEGYHVPEVNIISSDPQACGGHYISLEASVTGADNPQYLWSNGNTSQTIQPMVAYDSEYSVIVTDNTLICNQKAYDTVFIDINETPFFTVDKTGSYAEGSGGYTLEITDLQSPSANFTLVLPDQNIESFSGSAGTTITAGPFAVEGMWTIVAAYNGCAYGEDITISETPDVEQFCMATIAGAGNVYAGDTITLTAQNVDDAVADVYEWWEDANGNRVYDDGETILGTSSTLIYTAPSLTSETKVYIGLSTGFSNCSNVFDDVAELTVVPPPSIPTGGMVAYYPFSGNANDESGNANHGTVYGATLTTDRFGETNSAYSFDGNSDIVLPDSLIGNHSQLSISMWFKTTSSGCLIGNQHTEYPSVPSHYIPAIYIGTDGSLRGKFWNGYREPILQSQNAVNDGLWHMATLVTDGNNMSLYLDNDKVDEQTGTVSQLDMIFNQIGLAYTEGWNGGNNSWFYFNGALDDIRIYDKAITESEIGQLYVLGDYNPPSFLIGANTKIEARISFKNHGAVQDLSYYLVSPNGNKKVILKESPTKYDGTASCSFWNGPVNYIFTNNNNLVSATDTIVYCTGTPIFSNPSGIYNATGVWNNLDNIDPNTGGWTVEVIDYANNRGGIDGELTNVCLSFTDINAITGLEETINYCSASESIPILEDAPYYDTTIVSLTQGSCCPVVNISVPTSVNFGATITLSADVDGDEIPTSYLWWEGEFQDGTMVQGTTLGTGSSLNYTAPSTATIKYIGLTVTFENCEYTTAKEIIVNAEADTTAFRFTIDTDLGDGVADFTLPLREGFSYNMIVDWGDGATSTVTSFDDADITHTYSSGGEYSISITGKCGAWYFNGIGDKDKLIQIDNWGNVGFDDLDNAFSSCNNLTILPNSSITGSNNVTSFNHTFYSCQNLIFIPEELFVNNSFVTSFDATFSTCLNLTSIPENLFVNNPSVTSFVLTFSNCSNLTSIPENLFVNNPSVTSFDHTFRDCSNLTSIPENLFVNNPSVNSFANTFSHCSNLTSIPEELFANNPNVTSFYLAFSHCSNLSSIPDALFANNSSVLNFRFTFLDCTNLTGSSQQLWLNPSNATNYTLTSPGYDMGIPNGQDCYYGCTGLSDYDSIPSWWGGPDYVSSPFEPNGLAFESATGYGTATMGAFQPYAESGNTNDLPTILYMDTITNSSIQTSSNSGSFSWICEQNYPRVMIIERSGYVNLGSSRLTISNDYLTIYGQFAPGQGFGLSNGEVVTTGSHIVMQHIKFRGCGWASHDVLSVQGGGNIIFDHLSTSGGADEVLSISGNATENFTISNTIIAEPVGSHNYGSLFFNGDNITYDKVWFHSCAQRHPLINAGEDGGDPWSRADIINTLNYNASTHQMQISWGNNPRANIVGNVKKGGPNTTSNIILHLRAELDENCRVYFNGNSSSEVTNLTGTETSTILSLTSFYGDNEYTIWPYSQVEENLKATCGAFYWNRDDYDSRFEYELTNTLGSHPSSVPVCYSTQFLGKSDAESEIPSDWYYDDDGDGFCKLQELAEEKSIR